MIWTPFHLVDSYDFDITPRKEPIHDKLSPNYDLNAAMADARRTLEQILRVSGQPPEGSLLRIVETLRIDETLEPHILICLEIRFTFNKESKEHSYYLDKIFDNFPEKYDS
jgi:hypothetical protein